MDKIVSSEMAVDPLTKFSHKISIGDYNLQYVKVGHGPKVLFAFSGVMGPLKSSFIPLIEKIMEVGGDRYTFYGYDHAGYFGSGSPIRKLDDINFDVDVEIAAEFMKVMGHPKYDVLGYSAGSQISLLFAMKYPNLVNKLLIWGAWDRFEDEDIKLNAWYRDLKNVAGPFQKLLFEAMDEEAAIFHWLTWSDMILREYSNKNEEDWNQRFKTLRCPTLIIWGGRDLIVPRRQVDHLHNQIQNSRLVVFEKSPHNTHLIYTDKFYSVMDDFFMESDVCKNE